ncbi:MAG: serine/threonine protein kinase [Verrucomicrobia bacterium]|nr:MAG: serine/threonine protein kinase [Verrucomicrobiota bacterium]
MNTPLNPGDPCPKCGKPLPAGVLAGLCAACLLAHGSETQSGVDGRVRRNNPPPVAVVAGLFPQLEIVGLLGAGGMGAVYRARQPALDRWVALKLLPPDERGPSGFSERFNREARALARLSHPNIVAVHEFGRVEMPTGAQLDAASVPTGTWHYILMEYVDGANLRQLEKAATLSPREALRIIPQICDALQYAHDEGVVHRDIKPENVLVDRKGRVKIADFGLAKILGRDPESARLTVEGQVMGTPHYMAPEQLERPLAVDHRADIYSLGVVFYEMLTGDLPLGKFAPPSRKVSVDVRFDEIVLRALENDPELRYQQASEVKSRVETMSGAPAIEAGAGASPARDSRQLRWMGIPVATKEGGGWRVPGKSLVLVMGLVLVLMLFVSSLPLGFAVLFWLFFVGVGMAIRKRPGPGDQTPGPDAAANRRRWMGIFLAIDHGDHREILPTGVLRLLFVGMALGACVYQSIEWFVRGEGRVMTPATAIVALTIPALVVLAGLLAALCGSPSSGRGGSRSWGIAWPDTPGRVLGFLAAACACVAMLALAWGFGPWRRQSPWNVLRGAPPAVDPFDPYAFAAKVADPGYREVLERTFDRALDLDTGALGELPAADPLGKSAVRFVDGVQDTERRPEGHGASTQGNVDSIEVLFDLVAKPESLEVVGGTFVPLLDAEWETLGAAQVANRIGQGGAGWTSLRPKAGPGTMGVWAYRTREGSVGILRIQNIGVPDGRPSATVQWKGVARVRSAGSSIPAQSASPRPPETPVALRFLAWQTESASPGVPPASAPFLPDGSQTTRSADMQLAVDMPGTRCVSTLTNQPAPRFLHLWFSHPSLDREADVSVALVDTNGVPLRPASHAMEAGYHPPSGKDPTGAGWYLATLNPANGNTIPAVIGVRLEAAFGPPEHVREIPVDYHGMMSLEGGSMVGGIGENAGGKAFVTLSVDTQGTAGRKFCVRAVTRDGRVLANVGGGTGGPVNGAVRTETFEFAEPLSAIGRFRIGTRTVRAREWTNVVLPKLAGQFESRVVNLNYAQLVQGADLSGPESVEAVRLDRAFPPGNPATERDQSFIGRRPRAGSPGESPTTKRAIERMVQNVSSVTTYRRDLACVLVRAGDATPGVRALIVARIRDQWKSVDELSPSLPFRDEATAEEWFRKNAAQFVEAVTRLDAGFSPGMNPSPRPAGPSSLPPGYSDGSKAVPRPSTP